MSDSPRRHPHPGKYEGGLVVDQLAHAASMSGVADDEMGDSSTEAYACLIGVAAIDRFQWMDLAELDDVVLFGADLRFLSAQRWAIVREDAYGFVYVSWFADDATAQDFWDRLRVNRFPEEMDDDE